MNTTSHSTPSSLSISTTAAAVTVRRFTLAAMATGAIPVPAASAAIVAENAAMIAIIGSQLGVPISIEAVIGTLGLASSLNFFGRAVFVEVARWMGWFTGPAGVAGICALGATTAGLQTWIVGQVAIAVGKNNGYALNPEVAARTVRSATSSFEALRQRPS